MWVKFLKADRRRVRPKPGGIVTSVIDYKPGMVENVPRAYGEELVAAGKAEATAAPQRDSQDASTSPSGSSDSAAIDSRSRRRRSR